MLVEIERFVNWVRRRSPGTRTWKDCGCDLRLFVTPYQKSKLCPESPQVE